MNISQLRKRMLEAGVAVPAIALLGAGFAAPAYAQDDDDTPAPVAGVTEEDVEGERVIVVTGSLFRRTNTETASPVTTLSAESLEQRGINTVAEAVQRVSANGMGAITQGWNVGSNFATGANAVSLRGLTVQSTLTIFDGLRMAPYPLADDGHRNFVDLNTIPNSIIERIEVLRDGASSTYGADAVAGVVNVITKKEIQGLHMNGSYGISQEGDAEEFRADATWGYGDLEEDGFNFYVNGEYQRQDALWARDRQYPFNTSNLSNICDEATGRCMNNNIQNSYTNGRFNGLFATQVGTARPVTDAGAAIPGSPFQLLNPAAGCRELTPVAVPVGASASAGGTVQCSRDTRNLYGQIQPDQERLGFAARFTARIGDRAEFYAAGNYYQVETETTGTPSGFSGNLPPPNPAGFLQPSNLFLPVYVCGTGVGNRLMLDTGCNAGNGVLNPQNPYAASGNRAQLLQSYDLPRVITAKSRALRGAVGINGEFGDNWGYQVEATASQVQLDINQANYIIPQRLWDMTARGLYNFMDPAANTQEVRDYVAPLNSTRSFSDLWQVSALLTKEVFELPGGPLGVAIGGQYRHESIDNPSANPENLTSPYNRYFVANAVGAVGSRNVKSAFYEITAPVIDMLELTASGRYDDYSSGQKNFSPKFGATFKPIPELLFRGTWSKGFRIPSFNESFGLPTTGYVTYTLNPNDPEEAAFIAAHGGNSYATGSFPVGLTATGNPSLDPEKSTGWTAGVLYEPVRNVSFTVDYWHIKVKDIIGGADYSDVRNQYYSNNGVVNIPGITVVPGTPDTAFPNALPHLGFIQYSFQNNDSQVVSGLDFGANVRHPINDAITLTSSFEASYLIKFAKTIGGVEQRYDGTLSPCDVTSCSGSPKWRGSWQNTLQIDDLTATVTAYYTSGYDLASIDYGGIKGDCEGSAGASVVGYAGTPFLPVRCEASATWNVDFAASYRINDNFTIYGNVLNVLDIDPPFEPSAAYSLYQYNPAWAGANIMGRFFRVGVKADF
jgi:iron complex outermembrane receptor protein